MFGCEKNQQRAEQNFQKYLEVYSINLEFMEYTNYTLQLFSKKNATVKEKDSGWWGNLFIINHDKVGVYCRISALCIEST